MTGLLASETDMKIDEQAASLILQLLLLCREQDYYHKKYVEFTLPYTCISKGRKFKIRALTLTDLSLSGINSPLFFFFETNA